MGRSGVRGFGWGEVGTGGVVVVLHTSHFHPPRPLLQAHIHYRFIPYVGNSMVRVGDGAAAVERGRLKRWNNGGVTTNNI